MSNLLIIQLLFFATNFVAGESKELPLIFNTKTNSVVNLDNVRNSGGDERYAIACPVEKDSIPENEFRDMFSYSENMLFVKNVYSKLELINETNLEICETPFEASVVFNEVLKEADFGFEIYYDDSFQEINVSPREKYGPITNLPTKSGLVRQLTRTFTKNFTFPREEQKINYYNRKVDFLWISMYSLSYDREHLNPRFVTYEAQVDFPDPSKTCQVYELGEDIFKGIEMNEIYEEKNLEEIFEDIVKPEKPTNNNEGFFPQFAPESGEVCVTQTNLIPDKYFYFRTTKSLSCSYLTTTPLWCYIANGLLKQLDEYIDVLAEKLQLIGGKLRIVSGTNEILHMTKKYKGKGKEPGKFSLKKFDKEMYLFRKGKNNKIPMPTSVYKIIEYESSICPDDQKLCWYSVIIEISNNPYISIKDHICKDSKICLLWGWNFVLKDDEDMYFNCCENRPEIEKKLGLPKDEKIKKHFDLNKFSIPYSSENNRAFYKSLTIAIDERIAELHTLRNVGTGTSDQSTQKEAIDPINK